MLSEEKIIRMTKLAAFEKREGKKNLNIVNYYRNDYIGFQVLKSIIAVTISFVAVFALYLFYNFEALMHDVYKLDLMEFGKSVVIIYLCVAAGYLKSSLWGDSLGGLGEPLQQGEEEAEALLCRFESIGKHKQQ